MNIGFPEMVFTMTIYSVAKKWSSDANACFGQEIVFGNLHVFQKKRHDCYASRKHLIGSIWSSKKLFKIIENRWGDVAIKGFSSCDESQPRLEEFLLGQNISKVCVMNSYHPEGLKLLLISERLTIISQSFFLSREL